MNPPPLLFRSIDTDIYDACGITLDDTLVCWGSKYGSDFGAGTLIDDVCH
jgi:hypothetical protein